MTDEERFEIAKLYYKQGYSDGLYAAQKIAREAAKNEGS